MIEREPARYLPALLGLLGSPNVPPQALYWAVKIVGRLNRPEARAPLLALAAQPLAPELKAAAVEGVVAFGREEDVPLLLQIVNDPSPLVRQEALKGLLRFPEREDVQPLVLQGLTADDWFVRLLAVDVLRQQVSGRELTPPQRQALYSALELRVPEAELQNLPENERARRQSQVAQVRRNVAALLAESGEPEALARLQGLVANPLADRPAPGDPDCLVRLIAVQALANRRSRDFTRVLCQAFFDREDARIRLAAIAGVRQLRDQRALEYLVECLKLPPQARETREAAWQALKELAGQERPLNYSAWKTWWENNQFIETFARPRLNPSPTPPP